MSRGYGLGSKCLSAFTTSAREWGVCILLRFFVLFLNNITPLFARRSLLFFTTFLWCAERRVVEGFKRCVELAKGSEVQEKEMGEQWLNATSSASADVAVSASRTWTDD